MHLEKTCLALLLLIPGAFGSVVYSNTTTDTGDSIGYTPNGYVQIGDQITLAGTDRFATSATVEFFNVDTSDILFDATLDLYNVGAPVGAQIGSDFVMTGIDAPAMNVVDVTFSLGGILVPDDLIFGVSVSTGGNFLGLEMYEPPTVGLSDNTFAIANDGSGFSQIATANENVFFELNATSAASAPEPASFFLIAAGLLCIALWNLIWQRRFAIRKRSTHENCA